MTATDELRRMLNERNVEWKEHKHVMPGSMAIQRETLWGQPTDVASGKPIPHVYHYRATEMGDGRLFLEARLITPEQAIAATLGHCNVGRYVGLRQGKCWERTEASNYYCGGCGWKVTDHDSYCPECGGALHKATLGSSNCSNSERTETWSDFDMQMAYHMGYDDALARRKPDASKVHVLGRGTCNPTTYDNGYSMDRVEPGEYYEFWEPACACSECGELIPMRKFCPNCGRKVVDA